MTSFEIGLLVFACVFGGAVSGMLIGVALPEHHLSPETRSVVSVASGTISVLTALVIGLLIASTKGAFDTQTKEVQGFSADLSLLASGPPIPQVGSARQSMLPPIGGLLR